MGQSYACRQSANISFLLASHDLLTNAFRRLVDDASYLLLCPSWAWPSSPQLSPSTGVSQPIEQAIKSTKNEIVPVNHDLTLKNPGVVGAPAIVVLICMIVYVGFYSSGMGNTAWLSSEFFPMEVRAMGTMMLTMTCWGSNVRPIQ